MEIISTNPEDEYFMSFIIDVIRQEKIKSRKIQTADGSAKGENYLGIVRKVKVFGTDENNEEVELNLIGKMSPDAESRSIIRIDVFYKRELYFYTNIMPALENLQNEFKFAANERFNFVKCFSGCTEYLKEIIVFEDVSIYGFEMANRHVSLNISHVTLIMTRLGIYHALCFALKIFNPEQFTDFTANLTCEEINDSFEGYLHVESDRAIDALEDKTLKEKIHIFKKTAYDQLLRSISPEISAPYNVICHGDIWTNNVLFKYAENTPMDVQFLDWQMIKYGSPILDIFYLIFTSTDEDFRREHYADVLNIYYESLKLNILKLGLDLNSCYPEEIFKKHAKDYLPFGLVTALMTAALFTRDPDDYTTIKALAETEGAVEIINENSKLNYKKRITGIVKDLADWGAI